MPKEQQIIYVCRECGNEYSQWMGQCAACGVWNSLQEVKVTPDEIITNGVVGKNNEPVALSKIAMKEANRLATGISEFDRVLGGGLVPGSILLLGGEPGIGKSTILLQLASQLNQTVVYISGEESTRQIKLRADRLSKKNQEKILILAENNVQEILAMIKKLVAHSQLPALMIVDSIQAVYHPQYPSTPGSLVQVRESALRFQQLSKSSGISVIMVGHVTKEGNVAGPKTLEHLVDTVLYLEGERFHNMRLLRAVKNRFGATDEVGVFKMAEGGLQAVANPSEIFLAERQANSPGSVVTAVLRGSRPLLIEIQALTSRTAFGYPRRTASGFDLNRLQLIVAVLQKRVGLNLATEDIYVNVVGGVKLSEPAADLAVAMAVASSFKGKSLPEKLCAFGEIGLGGEIRLVSQQQKRRAEARRLGFGQFVESKMLKEAIENYVH